jgi:hypothetical protein
MFKINDIINKENYTKAAIWCTKNSASIEKQNGQYVIVASAPTEPTLEERVARLEAETGLTRIMREGILAEGSPYSAYAKEKALEIEELASQLRVKEDSGATIE